MRGVVIIIIIVVCNFQSVDQDVVQEENITIVEQAMDSAAGMTNLCGIIILSKCQFIKKIKNLIYCLTLIFCT